MSNGMESRFSSGRTPALSTPNTSATNNNDQQLPRVLDAVDELNRHPQGSRADQESKEEDT